MSLDAELGIEIGGLDRAELVAWWTKIYGFPRAQASDANCSARRCLGYSIGLSSALFGLAIFPAFYVATGIPETADYPASVLAVALGTIIFASGLWVFRISHKVLGRNWSITLQIREQHRLVCVGPYAVVRHPMYTSFLLIGIGQALLLSNWLIALAGLVGFAILFFLRVNKEERMMLENFGPQYRAYMERTKRIIAYLY